MAERLNITAHAGDKRCPREKFYGKVPSIPLYPFMMPGRRHRPRDNKMQSKGEICFYFNEGDTRDVCKNPFYS